MCYTTRKKAKFVEIKRILGQFSTTMPLFSVEQTQIVITNLTSFVGADISSHQNQHFHLNNANTTINSEYRLKKTIFNGYRSDVRPVLNEGDTLQLTLDVGIQQIIKVVT